MALRIISADQRLAEANAKTTAAIFGTLNSVAAANNVATTLKP